MATDEAAGQRVVAALWTLLRTVESGRSRAEIEGAATECAFAAKGLLQDEVQFVLRVRGTALFGNDRRIRSGVASLAANAGLVAILEDSGARGLVLKPAANALDYVEFAHCLKEARTRQNLEERLQARGVRGIEVPEDRDATVTVPSAEASMATAVHQLGGALTAQQLADVLRPIDSLVGRDARSSLKRVLDRMLRSGQGSDDLAGAQQDVVPDVEALLASVLAVLTAEKLYWAEERGTAAGVAALMGAGKRPEGDGEVAELARAARAVASLMETQDSPEATIERLCLNGQLSGSLADVMSGAVTPSPR